MPGDEPLEAEYSEDLEQMEMWCADNHLIKQMVAICVKDFDALGDDSQVSRDAAEIARNSITQGTQEAHGR